MKTTKLILLIVMIALALFFLLPNLSWADDGASIYKTKCAVCHGADLAGKPAAKTPSLLGDDAKKATDADLTDIIANGGKPVVKLVPLPRGRYQLGGLEGKLAPPPDEFFEPLGEDELAEWE